MDSIYKAVLREFDELQDADTINLKMVLNEICRDKSPLPNIVDYTGTNIESIESLREAIFRSIYQNPYFTEFCFEKDDLELFFHIFRDDATSMSLKKTKDLFARLFLALNVMNGKTNTCGFMALISCIPTVKLIERDEIIIENQIDLKSMFDRLKNNELIKSIVSRVVLDVCMKHSQYDFDLSHIEFFTCSDQSLNGYSGVDTIYVNYRTIRILYQDLKRVLSVENSNTLLKLNFIRLALHELTHVAIRHSEGNFNSSKTTLVSNENGDSINLHESGVLAEMYLLGDRIDWIETAKSTTLDMEYFTFILDKIIDGKISIEELKSTHVSSKYVKINGGACEMAIDLGKKSFVLYE